MSIQSSDTNTERKKNTRKKQKTNKETSKHLSLSMKWSWRGAQVIPKGIKGNKRITSPLIKYAFCFYLHTDSLKRSVKVVEDEQSESTAVTRNVFLLPVKSKVDSSSVGFFPPYSPIQTFLFSPFIGTRCAWTLL